MLLPLNDLFRDAHRTWDTDKRCVQLIRCGEAVAAVLASNVLAHYWVSTRLEPRLEKHVRELASPAFGTYVSILRITAELLESVDAPTVSDFLRFDFKADQSETLQHAIQTLASRFSLGTHGKGRVGTLGILDIILGVRNRGLGHGVLPEESCMNVERLCLALEDVCGQVRPLKILVVHDIRASEEHPGQFKMRGMVYDAAADTRWETEAKQEDLLELKRVYFLEKGEQRLSAPPFMQADNRKLWFLQRYRPGGGSPFTDLARDSGRTDPFWDEHLREFFDQRLERAGRPAVQCSPTGVYHDLPPETDLYPEFVGRQEYFVALQDLLAHDRQTHMVALGGVGGVGKTALARCFTELAVQSRASNLQFDYVVWLSAKKTVLKEEIERLTPAIDDIDDVLDEIARVSDSPELVYLKPFERKKDEVMGLLKSARFALVVDNFETVKNKTAFWDFLLSVPRPSKVLVTSRETFSEGCRTIEVKELGQEDAIQLFKNECQHLGVDLGSHLNKRSEKQILDSTGGIPVALKHIAILLERGVSLEQALQRLNARAGPVAEFCFRETFGALSKAEKMVWLGMGIFARPVAVTELVLVTDLPENEVLTILNTLKKYSIVNRAVDKENYETFSCLPLTLEFARKEAEAWAGAEEMAHRHRQYRALISRAGVSKEKSAAAKVFRETGVVHPRFVAQELARRALAQYRDGNLAEATRLIEEAERIGPREPSMLGTRAEIQTAEGQYEAARSTLRELLQTSPHDLAILRKLYYVENLLGDWDQAVAYLRKVTQLPGSTKKDWHILGTMYYRKARTERERGEDLKKQESLLNAIDCFNSSFIPNPKTIIERKHNAVTCDILARTHTHLRQYDEAEQVINRGLQLDPGDQRLLELKQQVERPRI